MIDLGHKANYPSRVPKAERDCIRCGTTTKRKPCGKTYCPKCVSNRYFAQKAEPAPCECGLPKTRHELKSGRFAWRCMPCWTASYKDRAQGGASNAVVAERIELARAERRQG